MLSYFVHHLIISVKLFKNNYVIFNSKKPNNQAANLPKGGIGNGNNRRKFWSYEQKQELSRQVQRLSGEQLQMIAVMVKVSCSHEIKIIQFKLVSVIF